ncbi:MAG: c-type cytochrome [Elainellaceae cyanobacterium]
MTQELLKDQITTTETETSFLRIVVVLLAIAAIISSVVFGIFQFQQSDPYIQAVLSSVGDSERGHAIFELNCSGCHGIYGDGRVGPSLHHISDHKSKVALIKQVTSGQTPPMPQFQPSPQEMADLLEYLERL